MRIGAHIKSAGGIQNVFERASAIGAEAIQLFITAPQQWRSPALTDEQAGAFRKQLEETGLPAFLHGVYLINLASEDSALRSRSVGSLKSYLNWGAKLGAAGTIFHVGSHKGVGFDKSVEQVCHLLREVLDDSNDESLLIIENNAGQGGGIGCSFREIGALIRGLDNDRRMRACIDTCHAFAMGYDIATPDGCEAAMEEFDREVGLDRLVAVHANDSKMPLGGFRDRHENIGDGQIGYDGFRTIMAHRAFRDVPFLLEVPGIDGSGPDVENIERLKKIRADVGALAAR